MSLWLERVDVSIAGDAVGWLGGRWLIQLYNTNCFTDKKGQNDSILKQNNTVYKTDILHCFEIFIIYRSI